MVTNQRILQRKNQDYDEKLAFRFLNSTRTPMREQHYKNHHAKQKIAIEMQKQVKTKRITRESRKRKP